MDISKEATDHIGFIYSLLTGAIAILFTAVIYFVKKILDKPDKIDAKLSLTRSDLFLKIDNLSTKIDLVKADLSKQIKEIESTVANNSKILMNQETVFEKQLAQIMSSTYDKYAEVLKCNEKNSSQISEIHSVILKDHNEISKNNLGLHKVGKILGVHNEELLKIKSEIVKLGNEVSIIKSSRQK